MNTMPSIDDVSLVIAKYSKKIDSRLKMIDDFMQSDNVELNLVVQTLEKELHEDRTVLAVLKHYYFNLEIWR